MTFGQGNGDGSSPQGVKEARGQTFFWVFDDIPKELYEIRKTYLFLSL